MSICAFTGVNASRSRGTENNLRESITQVSGTPRPALFSSCRGSSCQIAVSRPSPSDASYQPWRAGRITEETRTHKVWCFNSSEANHTCGSFAHLQVNLMSAQVTRKMIGSILIQQQTKVSVESRKSTQYCSADVF